MANETKSDMYAWKIARQKIHSFVKELDNPHLFTAWIKAQLIIEAQAGFHHHVGHSVEDSVAMAWEDFDVAARGKGEPGVAGAIFLMWSRIPKKNDAQLQRVFTEAFAAAQEATVPSQLRYFESVRKSRVLTLQDDFDLVEAFPLDVTATTERLRNAKDIKTVLDTVQRFKERGFTLVEGGAPNPEPKVETKPKARANAKQKPAEPPPQEVKQVSPVRLVDPDDVF